MTISNHPSQRHIIENSTTGNMGLVIYCFKFITSFVLWYLSVFWCSSVQVLASAGSSERLPGKTIIGVGIESENRCQVSVSSRGLQVTEKVRICVQIVRRKRVKVFSVAQVAICSRDLNAGVRLSSKFSLVKNFNLKRLECGKYPKSKTR